MKFCLILFLSFSISVAQKGVVKYGYIHSLTSGNSNGTDYNAYLAFNKGRSYYVASKDSLERSNIKTTTKFIPNDDDGGGTIINGMKLTRQGDQVTNDRTNVIMYSNLLYGEQLHIREKTPIISWSIDKQTNKQRKLENSTVERPLVFFEGEPIPHGMR